MLAHGFRGLKGRNLVGEPGVASSPSAYIPFIASVSSDGNFAIGAILGAVFGSIFAVVLVLLVLWWIRKNLKADSTQDERFLNSLPGVPQRYRYKELEVATSNFQRQLGRGGFGAVYAGVLANGETVAVKVLKARQEGSKDFRAEVTALASLRHVNLLRLLGFCAERSKRLLVYEHMQNGSLDAWIFNHPRSPGSETEQSTLDWSSRFKIALGTSHGLAYLHSECSQPMIHFDIKPQNVLLDKSFTPKVGDFGLSKLMEPDCHSSWITNLKGTPGYIAPEFLLGVSITEKVDVFGFGMVLLEIVSGRRNVDVSAESDSIYFPSKLIQTVAIERDGQGSITDLVDPALAGKFDEEEARRALKVGLWCIQHDPDRRPTMREVVCFLEGSLVVPDPPTQTGSIWPMEIANAHPQSGVDSQIYSGVKLL